MINIRHILSVLVLHCFVDFVCSFILIISSVASYGTLGHVPPSLCKFMDTSISCITIVVYNTRIYLAHISLEVTQKLHMLKF